MNEQTMIKPYWMKIINLPFGWRLRIHEKEGVELFSVRKPTIIHMHHTGPLLKYGGGFLRVEDLNPEIKTKWRMGRLDMLKMAWRSLVAAVS